MTTEEPPPAAPDRPASPDDYCRDVERYLCRKNDGHLVRIVGPAFELVTGWATSGIPLKVACRGIDRHFERYYSRGPRRWPVRIEFCEADVLTAYDEWRRAVGALAGAVAIPAPTGGGPDGARGRRAPALAAHLERVTLRLSSLLAGTHLPDGVRDVIEAAAREVDELRRSARGRRGAARQAAIDRLAALDRAMLDAALGALAGPLQAELRERAAAALEPFRARMPEPAFQAALGAAVLREVRLQLGLPQIALE